jgi:ribose 5-phosphate isomerase B
LSKWKILIGSDEAGYPLKSELIEKLRQDARVDSIFDRGVNSSEDSTPYPNVGLAVAEEIAAGGAHRALLICGTGIGMAISANKVAGVRATTAHDIYSLERSVLSNNCQVLALGGRVIAPELAWSLVDRWLDLDFDVESHSAAKVQIITDYEAQIA